MLTLFFAIVLTVVIVCMLFISGNTYENRIPVHLVPKEGIYNPYGGFRHSIFWNSERGIATILVPHGHVPVGWMLVREGFQDMYEYVGDLPVTIKIAIGHVHYVVVRDKEQSFTIVDSAHLKRKVLLNTDIDEDEFF